jgi:hypothetical protein
MPEKAWRLRPNAILNDFLLAKAGGKGRIYLTVGPCEKLGQGLRAALPSERIAPRKSENRESGL